METLKFEIDIQAPAEKVWQTLWNDDTYRRWTATFSEGSHAVTTWNEGDRIQFLGPEGDGMYSLIDKKVNNAYMAFKHLGEVKGGREIPPDENAQRWSGAMETYTLTESNGSTHLISTVQVEDDHISYFREKFPKALAVVKEISEE